jgi:serine/threonine-protein phosphatase 4 regulatory subunit 1
MFSHIMGAIVSLLDPKPTQPEMQTSTQTDTMVTRPISPLQKTPPQSPRTNPRPTHINLSNIYGTLSLSPSSSPQRENPFERPLLSPALTFYTAPSTPLTSPQLDDPPQNPPPSPPPEVVIHVPPPPTPATVNRPLLPVQRPEISPADDEAFPKVDQVPVDPFLDDEGLTSLEKIYLFSRSQATFHRCVRVCYDHHLQDIEARTGYSSCMLSHPFWNRFHR